MPPAEARAEHARRGGAAAAEATRAIHNRFCGAEGGGGSGQFASAKEKQRHGEKRRGANWKSFECLLQGRSVSVIFRCEGSVRGIFRSTVKVQWVCGGPRSKRQRTNNIVYVDGEPVRRENLYEVSKNGDRYVDPIPPQ